MSCRLAWGLEEPIGRYLSAHFPELMLPGVDYRPDRAVGFVDETGRLFGAIGLRFESGWEGQASIFVEKPPALTRSHLADLFGFVFGTLGLVRVTCLVAKPNRHARGFVERLGFRLEGVKRRAFDGRRDACVYGMLADECPWLRKEDDGRSAA